MTKREALNGKPYAGNPHVRFDEGEAASTATSRRGSLLYRESVLLLLATGMLSCVSAYGETSLDWKWDGSERAEATPAQIAFEGSNELHLNLVSKAGASGVAYRGTCFVIR